MRNRIEAVKEAVMKKKIHTYDFAVALLIIYSFYRIFINGTGMLPYIIACITLVCVLLRIVLLVKTKRHHLMKWSRKQ